MRILSAIPRGAFTLIEMMIAIGLGMLLVYAAMAGFRVASQTVTSANSLALENSLLRAGFSEALEELDFWVGYDNPNFADNDHLRLRDPLLPFSRIKTATDRTDFSTTGGYIYSNNENDSGWDSAYPWPANARRTWWRANAAEWHNSTNKTRKRFSISGDYSQFASTVQPTNHQWLFTQMEKLHEQLGYYAFCDYLPPSMLYSYIGRDPDQGNNVDMVEKFIRSGSAFKSGDGGASFAQGRYRCTKNVSFFLVPLKPLGTATQITQGNFRKIHGTGVHTEVDKMDDFMKEALSSRLNLEKKPEHWPTVQLEASRFFNHNRFVCLNKISLINPLTGKVTALSFTALGTTLRGARQQRKPSSPSTTTPPGWALWYGPNDIRNDIHLDNAP